IALAVGTVGLAILSRFSVKGLKRAGPFVLVTSIVLLVAVYFRGVAVGGNKNWLPIGPITVQPSEIAKLGLALYLGAVLAMFRHELTTARRIFVPGGIVAGVVLLLVLAGRDMGTAVVLCLVVAAAYWVAGLPLRFFALGAAGLVVGALALIADGSTRSA